MRPLTMKTTTATRTAVALFTLLCCCLLVLVRSYELPSGAEDLLKLWPPNTDFSCEKRDYGYYADVANACQLFHICLPIKNDKDEVLSTTQFTMLCSNGTVFDQQTLSCNYESDSYPCRDSEKLYGTVEFGKKN